MLPAGNAPLAEAETLPPAAPPLPPPPIATPLHIQRLEAALDMRPFMAFAREKLAQPLGSDDSFSDSEQQSDQDRSSDDEGSEYAAGGRRRRKRLLGTKQERQLVKTQIFNFKDLTVEREWLYSVLLSDTDSASEISDEDDYIKDLLKTHTREQRHRENFYKKTTNTQFAYYGTGFLSKHDMHPEHQQSIVGVRKRRRRTKKQQPPKLPKPPKSELPLVPKVRKKRNSLPASEQTEPGEINPDDLKHYAFGETSAMNDDEDDDDIDGDELDVDLETTSSSAVNVPPGMSSYVSSRGRRRKNQSARTPEVMAARRRKVWQLMAKKELGRCHRAKANNHKEVVQNCKRVASMCMKVVRQRAAYSQKVMKETVWRAKRLTREMLGYWKRYERVERDTRRRMEREAEEQRKMDVELIEAKRQQRKLNFLITQTELYAHFMSKKLGQGTEEEQLRILNQLDEDVNPRLAAYDDYDASNMKLLAQKNAELAFDTDRIKTRQFQVSGLLKQEPEEQQEEVSEELMPVKVKDDKADLPQPKIFKGTLKTYQIKGMTWLANIYDQGISGILADEMGLGKTVQSIAFLCHIAETYGVWGPFLIISPASTLHNWQQEMQRFVPDFNVVPYWGSPNERKILRQFWEQKDLHTKEASFHVVITSYQLIVSDYKYFNRIKWQYMVLDEAQAIKSATSARWKLLLGFNCRNRLLLSGTPIQNSMAELWALLHFIMPTLFDSHDEFNEWFSKDIESHAENKTGIDEKQISRLHMILKPFMLRRIKKDVENELSDKIEIMVYCPLTIRQKLLYMALKKKIRIEDLLHLTGGGAGSSSGDGHHVDRNFTSNLMNLVMQFRKVCNHPELFERRDAKSPFTMRCEEYVMPRLVFEEALLLRSIPSKRHLLYNRFCIFKAEYIQHSLFSEPKMGEIGSKRSHEHYARYIDLNASDDCGFSFARLCDFSPLELEAITVGGLINFLESYLRLVQFYALLSYRYEWWEHYQPTRFCLLEPMLQNPLRKESNSVLNNFLFTGMTTNDSAFYTFGDYKTFNMQETIEHRVIRSKNYKKAANVTTSLTPAKVDELEDIKSIKKEEQDLDVVNCDEDSSSQAAATVLIKSMNDEKTTKASNNKSKAATDASLTLQPEFPHKPRKPNSYSCEPLEMPRFLYNLSQRVQAVNRRAYCESRAAEWSHIRHTHCENSTGLELINIGLNACKPRYGWSSIVIPDKQTLVSDAGKLAVLDSLLTRLKAQGHRVLIYSQMTKMIDLLEEYMWHRKHRYMRLDGSSKISARRDMVADFQSRTDIFVFLLSTRAGGLGINLTAADTVIFYDSDWNPTVDQQAMDRAHRLGQTKQVTVYRLICKGTIEERILQRAREKSEIQRMVISGGNFKPDTLKPKEVVSLLLDDEEIELKYRQKADEKKTNITDSSSTVSKEATTSLPTAPLATNDRKRKLQSRSTSATGAGLGGITIAATTPNGSDDNNQQLSQEQQSPAQKRLRLDTAAAAAVAAANNIDDDSIDASVTNDSTSPAGNNNNNNCSFSEPFVPGATTVLSNDDSDNEALIVDCESPMRSTESPSLFGDYGSIGRIRRRHHPRGTRRGRPRGSRRGGGNGSLGRSQTSPVSSTQPTGCGLGEDGTSTTATATTPPTSTPLTNTGEGQFTPTAVPTPMKRGPGRPRLKTAGPPHQGTRGAPRTRKPIGPLMVPLGQSPAATPHNRSPAISPAPSPAHSERSSLGGTGGAGGSSTAE